MRRDASRGEHKIKEGGLFNWNWGRWWWLMIFQSEEEKKTLIWNLTKKCACLVKGWFYNAQTNIKPCTKHSPKCLCNPDLMPCHWSHNLSSHWTIYSQGVYVLNSLHACIVNMHSVVGIRLCVTFTPLWAVNGRGTSLSQNGAVPGKAIPRPSKPAENKALTRLH